MSKYFSTVAVVAKPDGTGVREPLDAIIRMLKSRGILVLADDQTASYATVAPDRTSSRDELETLLTGADLAIAVGGDGTMLGVSRIAARHGVRLIGVNLGHLGFLTDIASESIAEMLTLVLDGNFTEEPRIF